MRLDLASIVFLGSELLGTRDHILLSQIWDFPFRRLLPLAESRGKYSIPLPHGCTLVFKVKSSHIYITTDSQLASLSWCQSPIWGLRPDFYYCQTVECLLIWGALSDERTGLPFKITAGPRQRSQSWVRVPRDSWPYFTVSDSRPPQPGGPGPRIYIPQEQGGIPKSKSKSKSMSKLCYDRRYSRPICLGITPLLSQSQSYIATDGRSVSKSWCRAPSGAHDQVFIIVWQLRSCFCGAPSLTS
jgi:hypothetical protein